MSMSSPLLDRIAPLVRQILQAPNIVPSRVSAKTVRKSLVEEHSVDKERLAAEKDAVRELILTIFQEIYPDEGATAGPEQEPNANATAEEDTTMRPTVTPMKKKQHPQVTASQASASASVAPSSPAVPLVEDANRKKRKRDAENDEDLAKRLHQSLNEERSTRGTSSSGARRKKTTAAGEGKGKKSRVKSKAIVDDEEEEEEDGTGEDGKAKKKRKAKPAGDGTGAAKGGFSKPMILSEELADVLATDTLSRPQVVKQIWDYIKNHELQNPQNKRLIVCDEKLQRVFKVPEIDMFQMNKVLSSHLRTAEE